ncbi:MAG: DHA2 family efflux MFS transporter permease subunit [Clostridia bacterium]|nr:MAG: DHA2 family efflux MFS transporter permease subunit [Clostridia bacterium]
MPPRSEGTTSVTGQRYQVLAAIMLGGIMGPIDASIVNVILPTITGFFHAPLATAQWVPLIYLLTISSLLLFYGRLGDILGYKRVYLAGLVCFTVASGLCGLAPTIYWLIAFRALQGVGAGMMMAVPYAILTAAFPPQERGRALGLNAISISAGLAIGPTLGGLLTSLGGWRLAFLINIPVGLAGLLWGRKVIPDWKGQPGKMDARGAATAFIFLFSFLYFINQAQRLGPGITTGTILAIAIIAGAGFLYLETRSPQPMVNLALFRNRTFSLNTLSALLNFVSQYIMVFLTPFYLQRVLHYPPDKIGLLMTSFPLAVMAVAPFSGALSDRVGTRTLAAAGAAICALALVTMALLPVAAPPLAVGWRLALFGLGTGIFQSPNNSAVMGSVPRPYLGIASGVLATARNTGMALGIATGGLILYALVPPAVMAQNSLDALEAAHFLTGLRYAYLSGAGLTALAAVFSFVQFGAGIGKGKT